MKKLFKLFSRFSLLLLVIAGVFLYVPFASAAEPTAGPGTVNSGQALEIGPPVINLSADPGETVKAQISLRDIAKTNLVVTNEINDFVADGESGVPKILLDTDETSPYSMKSWITPVPKFTLIPKQVKQLAITVTVPKDASPGGYYSLIRFTGTPPDIDGTGVSLSASLGALVLMTVKGEAREMLSIEEFSVTRNGNSSSIFESMPNGVLERLRNTGNIHEQPVGQIDIKDMFGNLVGTVIVNNPSPRSILPNSTRKLEQQIDEKVVGNKFFFGQYTANLSLTYGVNNQVLNASATFWVIPYTLLAIIIVSLVVLFFVLRFVIKKYNERIVRRAGGRGRGRR